MAKENRITVVAFISLAVSLMAIASPFLISSFGLGQTSADICENTAHRKEWQHIDPADFKHMPEDIREIMVSIKNIEKTVDDLKKTVQHQYIRSDTSCQVPTVSIPTLPASR